MMTGLIERNQEVLFQCERMASNGGQSREMGLSCT